MKDIYIYILKLIFVFIIIGCLIRVCFLSEFYGNDILQIKTEILKSSKTEYNLIFVGSSKTYRHINTLRLNRKLDKAYKSFNIGSPGTFSPELVYVLSNILYNPIFDSFENIIIEADPNVLLAEENISSVKYKYYSSLNILNYLLKTYLNTSTRTDLRNFKRHSISYFYRIMNFNLISEIITHTKSSDNDLREVLIEKDGYLSLQNQVNLLNSNGLRKRREITFGKPKVKNKRKANKVYLEKLYYFSNKFRTKGKNLVFIDKSNFLNNDPNLRIIDMEQVDSLIPFNKTYYFDKGHYTNKGSNRYTDILYKKLLYVLQ